MQIEFKKLNFLFILIFVFMLLVTLSKAEAKSTVKSYSRSSGVKVKPYVRYKADGYKFNNYSYRPDRGYKK